MSKAHGRIFLIDDEELVVSMLARVLKKEGYETRVQTSAEDAVNNIASWHPDLVLLDIHLDEDVDGIQILQQIKTEEIDTQVVMLTADDRAETAIKAMKLGAVDYLNKPFNSEEVKIVIKGILEKGKLKDEVSYLRKSNEAKATQKMVGESPVIKDLMFKAQRIAEAGAQTILITGESGTGKEVLARYIHDCRNAQQAPGGQQVPYVTVNCTALPDNLIESELFGHSKWAFTDAKAEKKGMFELADGGTILLDEIGDMRLELQSKFLRVLEERKVRRLGGKTDLPVDVTVIATTNKDLKAAVAAKQFREDLYFRLSTFAMHLPPLRERSQDIALLARFFLAHFARKYDKKKVQDISPEAEQILCSYGWPGNIRELRNVIERCVVLESAELITADQLPAELAGGQASESFQMDRIILPAEGLSLEKVEQELLRQALERTGYNQTKAAKLLQISYDTLRYQAKKYGLL
ncbi:MAG: sigma-54-dependent Fis family transcriptional regulator [Deltaproteobacteria bacterium]|nr:sigma-54-dependent Fis family transcriptional regulator [Candidatus Anaeroferrophillus wilburensis]MBN2887994.1 sigma-54-dependent Fis family transcriptional regulator [Deltaproteobacteria bacterium]